VIDRRAIERFVVSPEGRNFVQAYLESGPGQQLVAAEVRKFWRQASRRYGAAKVKAAQKKLERLLAGRRRRPRSTALAIGAALPLFQ